MRQEGIYQNELATMRPGSTEHDQGSLILKRMQVRRGHEREPPQPLRMRHMKGFGGCGMGAWVGIRVGSGRGVIGPGRGRITTIPIPSPTISEGAWKRASGRRAQGNPPSPPRVPLLLPPFWLCRGRAGLDFGRGCNETAFLGGLTATPPTPLGPQASG